MEESRSILCEKTGKKKTKISLPVFFPSKDAPFSTLLCLSFDVKIIDLCGNKLAHLDQVPKKMPPGLQILRLSSNCIENFVGMETFPPDTQFCLHLRKTSFLLFLHQFHRVGFCCVFLALHASLFLTLLKFFSDSFFIIFFPWDFRFFPDLKNLASLSEVRELDILENPFQEDILQWKFVSFLDIHSLNVLSFPYLYGTRRLRMIPFVIFFRQVYVSHSFLLSTLLFSFNYAPFLASLLPQLDRLDGCTLSAAEW